MSLVIHPKTQLQLEALKHAATGSIIFHGPDGIGKHAAAVRLAMELNCLGDTAGLCVNCRRIQNGNFADLLSVAREDKASIAVDQIRKLSTDVALRPAQSTTSRVVIVQDAQTLTLEAQNAFLKLLEEPPPATLIILLTERFDSLIPTIRSRCRQILFISPGEQAVAQYLRNEAHLDEAGAKRLAASTEGLPGLALTLRSDPEAATALAQLDELAASVIGKTTFNRLLIASKLASGGADLGRFGRMLQRTIANQLTSGTIEGSAAAALLQAVETFRRQLAAKVAPRVALERLMLELR